MITFRWLFDLAKEYRRELVLGNIIALLATLVSIPIPLLIPMMVDEVLLEKRGFIVDFIDRFGSVGEPLLYIAIVLAVTIALRFVFYALSVISQKFFIKLSQELSFALRKRALLHLERVSMASYEALGSGKVITHLITDIDTIEQFLSSALSKLIIAIATLVGVAVVLIWINPLFGVLILIFQPLIMLLTKKISQKVGVLKKEQNKTIGEFSDNLTQMCDLFGQIRASNKERSFIDSAIKKSQNLRQKASNFTYEALKAERFSYTVFLSGYEIFRAFGLVMVLYSDLTIGMMFGVFGYLWFMMTPIQDMITLQYSYANALNAMSRLNELFALPLEPVRSGKSKLSNDKPLSISTKNLSFGYSDELILKDISIDIKSGSTVAIIGSSGSGKSTLSQLLVGFYPPTSGEIYYDGISYRDLGLSEIRDHIFVVLQSPMLFNDTLRFNLTMGEDIDVETIKKALKIAQLDGVVAELSNGLDTQVGKFGVRLSGGQRQRLSIARMIIANPEVIIFDESTSALDVHTEESLFRDLTEFLSEKTVILIAHRLSTINHADYIYVLENGVVVEEGSFSELSSVDGHFKRFKDAQE